MMPTLILSDTHLANPASHVRAPHMLRPLWRGMKRLIINGDAAEVHHPHWRAAAARQILELQQLCEQDGVALTLLSGNHDPFISDQRHLLLHDGEIFITHGDVLHPAIAPWSDHAHRLADQMHQALMRIEPAARHTLEARLAAAQHASHMEWLFDTHRTYATTVTKLLVRPLTVARLLHYWWRVPQLADAFLRLHAPQARFMVLGHTHRQGIWAINNRVIFNTGSFSFPARPRAIVIADGTLAVHPIRRTREAFTLSEQPCRSFALSDREADLPALAPLAAVRPIKACA